MRHLIPPILLGLTLGIFLALNVIASQVFNPLLFRLVKLNDIQAGKQFLRAIEETKDYPQQLSYLNQLFDNAFTHDLDQNEFSINQELEKYQNLLLRNQNSRDILMKLALLHYQKKEYFEAKKHYQEARAIDPWLSVPYLETL